MEKSQVEDTEEGLHMEVEEEARPRPTSSADVTTELVSDDEPQDTNTVDQIVSHKGNLNIDVIDPLHCAVKKFGDEKCDYMYAVTHKDGDDSSRSFRVRSPVMAQPPVHFVDLDEIKLKDDSDSDSAEEILNEQNSETDTCKEGEGSQSQNGDEALFKCSKYAHCKKVFTSAVDLTAHQGNKYSCTVCGEAFPKLKGLGEHMRRHTEKQDLKDMKSLTCTCPICKKAFESDSLLKEHVLIHAFRHKPYICKICNKTFDLKQRLEYHQRRCRYKCGFCDGKFITKGELIEHVKVHQSTEVMSGEESIKSTSPGEKSLKSADANSQGSESVFKCLYCDREFQKKSQLEVHEIIHTRNRSSDVFARGPFVCEFCGRKFASPAGLGTHERVHTTQHQYKCSFCRKHFNSNADLAIHVRTHQTQSSKPYVCGFCNATFLQENELNDHECSPLGDDSQSGSTDMLVQDSTEDETFDITNSLSTNRQKIASGRDIALGEGQGQLSSPEVALTTEGNHGNVEVSDDVCEDNGLKLSGEFSGDNKVLSPKMAASETFEMLNRDEKLPSRSKTRHENRKKRDTTSSSHRDLNYKCKNCPSAFRLESELEKHNTQNHICNICGRILANKYTLSAHLNTHTQDPNYKPFKCPYCDKTFMHKNGLRKHITVHSGVRQYICDICQKTFRLRHLLNQHRKIHVGNTDLLKYRCDFCQKCFKRKELCNQHIRDHMTGDPLACKRYCPHCHIVFKKMYPSDVYPHVKPGHISGHADNE